MQVTFHEPKSRDGKVIAFADVDVGGGVIVKGFRVIDGENGLFVGVPSRPTNVNGQTRYWNQVTFKNTSTREAFLSKVLEAHQAWRESETRGKEEAG